MVSEQRKLSLPQSNLLRLLAFCSWFAFEYEVWAILHFWEHELPDIDKVLAMIEEQMDER